MQVICCVCHKTKGNNGWAKQAARYGVRISHAYCPQCYRQMLEKVENFFGSRDYAKSA